MYVGPWHAHRYYIQICCRLIRLAWRPRACGLPRILTFLVAATGFILTSMNTSILPTALSNLEFLWPLGVLRRRPCNTTCSLWNCDKYRGMDYKLPLTTCASCESCGIGNFSQIPACTSLVVRTSFFGEAPPVSIANRVRHLFPRQLQCHQLLHRRDQHA